MARTRVEGVRELNRKVARMPDAIKQAIREALEESAEELVGMMKRLVPVDQGDLRDSIGWTFGSAPQGSISIGSIADAEGMDGLRVTVYAGNRKAYYARWQEFGTQNHPAQPFFFVSYRALRRRIRSRITRRMNAAIKRFVNG